MPLPKQPVARAISKRTRHNALPYTLLPHSTWLPLNSRLRTTFHQYPPLLKDLSKTIATFPTSILLQRTSVLSLNCVALF